MNLPQVPPDKAQHFIYGACIAIVGVVICVLALHKPQYAVLGGAVLCVGFAVGKEAVDWFLNRRGEHHVVELLDAVATLAGGFMVLFPAALLKAT